MHNRLVVFFLFTLVLWSCTENGHGNIARSAFKIEGMTCQMGCARSIEEALLEIPGVTQVQVDFNSEKATVVFDTRACHKKKVFETVESLGGGKYKIQDYTEIEVFSKSGSNAEEDEKENPTKEPSRVQIPLEIPFPNIFDFIELR